MASSKSRPTTGSADEEVGQLDHLEFSSIKGLGDKVFAFAMTLLVYNLATPDVPADRLAGALAGQVPQFAAFILSFAVVANVWWQHHKLTSMFRKLEPVMAALYFMLLAVVVLVPFSSGLIGSAPHSQAAVLFFISLFVILNCLCVFLTLRANSVDAWRHPVSSGHFYWLLFNFIGGMVLLAVALVVSLWYPLVGLSAVAAGAVVGPLLAPMTYDKYGNEG